MIAHCIVLGGVGGGGRLSNTTISVLCDVQRMTCVVHVSQMNFYQPPGVCVVEIKPRSSTIGLLPKTMTARTLCTVDQHFPHSDRLDSGWGLHTHDVK